jgi:hypothetical protein
MDLISFGLFHSDNYKYKCAKGLKKIRRKPEKQGNRSVRSWTQVGSDEAGEKMVL